MEAVLYLGNADRMTELSGSSYGGPREFTRIALVPMSGPGVKQEGLSPAYKNDVAVCFAYYGKNVDRSGRSGVMRAMVVMSPTDAQTFVDEVQKAPELAYALLRQVNGGPITREDGTPLDTQPGKLVEILPNEKVGGKIKTKLESKPFPPDFKPNPLF